MSALIPTNVNTDLMGKAETLEKALLKGDLSNLSPAERLSYYSKVCESLGLNPYTKPFEFIDLKGKLTLYAKRDCTEQLRKIHGVSINITGREMLTDVYVVTAKAVDKNGRIDESIGVVPIKGLGGENLANALMKAETKAKRRVTLSICGLGTLDESELDTIPNAKNTNFIENQTIAWLQDSGEKVEEDPYKGYAEHETGVNGSIEVIPADDNTLRCEDCGAEITERVAKFSKKYYSKSICPACQNNYSAKVPSLKKEEPETKPERPDTLDEAIAQEQSKQPEQPQKSTQIRFQDYLKSQGITTKEQIKEFAGMHKLSSTDEETLSFLLENTKGLDMMIQQYKEAKK